MPEIQYHADTMVLRKPPEPHPYRQLSFHGDGSTMFGITLVNLFLTVVTLGIYLFWGKVKARKYIFGQLEFEGDRFAYHATGKELLIGWLKVAIFLGILYGAQNAGRVLLDGPVAFVLEVIGSVGFVVLLPIATVASRRFRLSRTSWRGIRFSFRGRTRDFLKLYFRGTFLTAITFGLYYPFFMNEAQRFLMSRTYFGNTRFEYNGEGKGLFKIYLFTRFIPSWAVGLVVLAAIGYFWSTARGIEILRDPRPLFLVFAVALIGMLVIIATLPFFTAARDRYVWSHTTFVTARFRSTVTAGRLYRLYLGDIVRLVFTLGFALPWVVVRHVQFRCANLFVEGPLDLAAIQQEAQAASAVGEGLGDFFGILDFDLGL